MSWLTFFRSSLILTSKVTYIFQQANIVTTNMNSLSSYFNGWFGTYFSDFGCGSSSQICFYESNIIWSYQQSIELSDSHGCILIIKQKLLGPWFWQFPLKIFIYFIAFRILINCGIDIKLFHRINSCICCSYSVSIFFYHFRQTQWTNFLLCDLVLILCCSSCSWHQNLVQIWVVFESIHTSSMGLIIVVSISSSTNSID